MRQANALSVRRGLNRALPYETLQSLLPTGFRRFPVVAIRHDKSGYGSCHDKDVRQGKVRETNGQRDGRTNHYGQKDHNDGSGPVRSSPGHNNADDACDAVHHHSQEHGSHMRRHSECQKDIYEDYGKAPNQANAYIASKSSS